ncbi:hypothetical protein JTE90_001609 [Oedothorax gibbosus]|uniref:Uncharacterized protein n=1 Tax=Oedothorax gibbosus TaxID=931172 RepID=A0AAV6VLS8_9ARAC|nr:hypothetical protein JTE90_001609 [Oedothorax gibbosus]
MLWVCYSKSLYCFNPTTLFFYKFNHIPNTKLFLTKQQTSKPRVVLYSSDHLLRTHQTQKNVPGTIECGSISSAVSRGVSPVRPQPGIEPFRGVESERHVVCVSPALVGRFVEGLLRRGYAHFQSLVTG